METTPISGGLTHCCYGDSSILLTLWMKSCIYCCYLSRNLQRADTARSTQSLPVDINTASSKLSEVSKQFTFHDDFSGKRANTLVSHQPMEPRRGSDRVRGGLMGLPLFERSKQQNVLDEFHASDKESRALLFQRRYKELSNKDKKC